MIPIFQYAETHFRLKYLKPAYYRKQPEILADFPYRIFAGNQLPLLIICKDADKFPAKIISIDVYIHHQNKVIHEHHDLNIMLHQKYFSKIIHLNTADFEFDQNLLINVKFSTEIDNKKVVFNNDNYRLEYEPFKVFFAEKRSLFPENWFAGEPHYHSNFTDDQVEFGADISSTKVMAKAIGLDWFFVTDHSYDLDDKIDSYLENDDNLPKWKLMKSECAKNDSEELRVIHGEEISIGNSRQENVHCLSIKEDKFFPGKGDGAEQWFQNHPDLQLQDISNQHKKENLFIAAHPAEKVPFAQKLTLRRGNWSIDDFDVSNIDFAQFINSDEKNQIEHSLKVWTELLLRKKKTILLAGNDAHGNFNSMRQIDFPFLTLFRSYKQIFGKFKTIFCHYANDPIAGIKKRKVIVSNGPFLDFQMGKFCIGETADNANEIKFQYRTSVEFGAVKNICIYIGDYSKRTETKIINPTQNYLPKIRNGYIRMSLLTKLGGKVFTNPIWIKNKEDK